MNINDIKPNTFYKYYNSHFIFVKKVHKCVDSSMIKLDMTYFLINDLNKDRKIILHETTHFDTSGGDFSNITKKTKRKIIHHLKESNLLYRL